MGTTLILVVGGSVALLMLIIGMVISAREDRSVVQQRLGRYLDEEEAAQAATAERSTAVGDWVNDQVSRFSWSEGISKDLARADLKLRVGEYLAVVVIAVVGGAAVAWLVGGRAVASAGIGAVIGFFLPRVYVGRQKAARLQRFDDELSDMLNLMVNGLRAGYSTMQAMEAVSKELPPPICDEFRRVVQEMQLGISMEKSLENLTRRIPSKDLDLVVTAVNVQREVGGNLAEILGTISHTIRERVRVKGEIRVLTSQAMISAKFLSLMPVIVFVALYFVNRPYIMELLNPETRNIGIPVLIVGVVMISLGYFVMTRIANIEV
ncbi:MAG: type II secretion system F family protein [Chloroflexota bacterium]